MIITIVPLTDDELFKNLDTLLKKTLLSLYQYLIDTEQYEYCQVVLDEIKKRNYENIN
jgi:hypothetical protein